MERTVLSHDVGSGIALIRFVHNDVTIEQEFNLKLVVPGSQHIFEQMGIAFTEAHQLTALDKLTEILTFQIDSGAVTNPPGYEAPIPVVEEPTEENTNPDA